MVQHPWSYRGDNPKYADNLQGLLLDVETWAREGLMDAAVPAGYYAPHSGGTPELRRIAVCCVAERSSC